MSEHKRADGGDVIVSGSPQISFKHCTWQQVLVIVLAVGVVVISGFIVYKSFHHEDPQVAAIRKQIQTAQAKHSPNIQAYYQELAQRCAAIHDIKCAYNANQQLAKLVPANSLEYLMSAAATAAKEGNKQLAIHYYQQSEIAGKQALAGSPLLTKLLNTISADIKQLGGTP